MKKLIILIMMFGSVYSQCLGDMNGDGIKDILDIVNLVNDILDGDDECELYLEEFNVEYFSFYPNVDTLTYNLDEELFIQVQTYDVNGVGVENIPISFSLTYPFNGVISDAIIITHNSGIGGISYFNSFGGGDTLKSFILNPLDNDTLFVDQLYIQSGQLDCAGIENGTNWESDCGCVVADNSGDDCDDCLGIPNGIALVDECGICDDDISNDCIWDFNVTVYSSGNSCEITIYYWTENLQLINTESYPIGYYVSPNSLKLYEETNIAYVSFNSQEIESFLQYQYFYSALYPKVGEDLFFEISECPDYNSLNGSVMSYWQNESCQGHYFDICTCTSLGQPELPPYCLEP